MKYPAAITGAYRTALDWILHSSWRSAAVTGACGLLFAATLTVALGFPPPAVHDEFSYLLSADTFAEGRLANPAHPHWRHFETFHVLQVPTYASKYPPAPGLVMALGSALTGRAIVGVWLAFALLAIALNWMLRAWVRPRWALLGAIAATIWLVGRHAMGGYWAWSYWGGSVPAIGGALVLGGFRRLAREPDVPASLAFGTGLGVLALSRPFEGLLFSVAPVSAVLWLLIRWLTRRDLTRIRVALLPMSLTVGACLAFMAVHNASVTGSLTTPPYIAYDRMYAASPHLLGQDAPRVPEYNVPVMEQFYVRGTGRVTSPGSLREYAVMVRRNAAKLVPFYLPWFVIPLVFVIPALWRARGMLLVLASLASAGVAFSITLYEAQPHYAAPAAAAWCLLLLSSARFLSQWRWRGQLVGRALTQVVFAGIVLSAMAQLAVGFLRLQPTRGVAWQWQRQEVARSLPQSGSHLVFVEYAASHEPDEEWVYNAADIDASPIVWARSLGDSADAELRRFFAGRSAWRVHVDSLDGPPRLTRLGPEQVRRDPSTP